jgi:hypothetical protein
MLGRLYIFSGSPWECFLDPAESLAAQKLAPLIPLRQFPAPDCGVEREGITMRVQPALLLLCARFQKRAATGRWDKQAC